MINDGLGMNDKMSFAMGRKIEEGLSLKANVHLKLFDENGKLKDTREVHNLVTTLGKYMAAAQILATPGIVTPGWMEVGTGSGGAAGDSTLKTYIAASRTALDSKTRNNAVVTMVCTMGAGVGTGAITEAGVFNVVTQNTTDLLLYADFSVINKAAGDSLVITWTITFA
jgi:hypothetical protein